MRATAQPLAAATGAIELRAGDRIEKYELLRSVAQGGMGSVWAAKLHGPHDFEKIVAIKTVLPELAGDAAVRAMFLDEVRLASAVVHRNVAQVLDFLEHSGALYIVMEWVDGIPLVALHDRLAAAGTRIPIGIALRVLADVCAGLHAAHELTYADGEPCGLVHRDVSPHNVLVANEGSAKLIDFGVAKTRSRVAPDSTLGELRGRLAFMAPEQAASDPLDRRADVWSVGASLFHLLAGHGPFGACESIAKMRHLLKNAHPLPPPSNAHPAVARVLSGCLARRREDRFPTAQHLGWAIEGAIEEMAVSATARDVAEFLADRTDPGSPRLVRSGCRRANPGNTPFAKIDTHSHVRPAAKFAVSRLRRPSNVRRMVAAFACVSGIGLGMVGARGVLQAPFLDAGAPAAAVSLRVVEHSRKVELPTKDALAPHDEAQLDERHLGRARAKVRSAHHAEPKGNHERSGGTQ